MSPLPTVTAAELAHIPPALVACPGPLDEVRKALPQASVYLIDGACCATAEALWQEFGEKLGFMEESGHNWNAFDENLGESELLAEQKSILIVVSAATQLLVEEPSTREIFTQIVQDAIRGFAAPIEEGEPWDRPAIPCHVVLLP